MMPLALSVLLQRAPAGCVSGMHRMLEYARLRRQASTIDVTRDQDSFDDTLQQQQQQQRQQQQQQDDYYYDGGGGDEIITGEPECYGLYHLLNFFSEYYIPLIILLGLIGNLLSVFVFMSNQLRVRSSSYYLAALALADFSFLTSLLLVWLDTKLGWRVFNEPGWCEATVYASSVCSSLSVWLIVGFTVERYVAVQYPLRRPRVCTARRAKLIVIALVTLALASHSYCFVIAGLVTYDDGTVMCEMKSEYFETMRIVSIVDSLVSLVGPIVLIVVMNTCIWRNLLRFGKLFAHQRPINVASSGVVFATATVNAATTTAAMTTSNGNLELDKSNNSGRAANCIALTTIISGLRRASKRSFRFSQNSNRSRNSSQTSQRQQQQQQQQISASRNQIYHISKSVSQTAQIGSSSRNLMSTRNQQNITKMLLLISTVFILLNLPSYVMRLCVFFFTLAHRNTPTILWCFQQIFMVLYYTNFSINFLLYSMCGVTFRRCLRQILCKFFKRLQKYYCF